MTKERHHAFAFAALALPMVSLAAIWGVTDYQSRQGTDWEVPVRGYDPRDLLRGHYVQYSYDWPLAQGAEAPEDWLADFCIEGTPPKVDRIVRAKSGADSCANYVRDSEATTSGRTTLRDGRLYIPQKAGPGMEVKLRDPGLQGVIRFRLREDGHLTPLEMIFRPRSPIELATEGAADTQP